MGRTRQALGMKREGSLWVVRFKHPLSKRTVRCSLGNSDAHAGAALGKLNTLFLNEEHWNNPPEGTPQCVLDAWGAGVSVDGSGTVRRGDKKQAVDSAENAVLRAELDAANAEITRLEASVRQWQKTAEHWKGRRIRKGACPTLAEAKAAWLALFKGKDSKHTETVAGNLKAFVDRFKPETLIDDMAGREREIAAWLAGLTVSPSRRQQIRIYALKLLEESGCTVDRNLVPSVGLDKIREARQPIRWLEKGQAEAVARALPPYWADLFRTQVGTGLRPDELLTLRRDNFTADYERLTLAPWKHLTLKRGPRTVQVPVTVRAILKRRLEAGDFAFPDPKTGKPWVKPSTYNRRFSRALEKAGTAAGIQFKLDCRVGRRTCGSLLVRSGMSTEKIAAVLGNSPAMVREHYARILPSEVDPSAAALA